ncbi:cytochrome c2 [Caldalkalibacillus uzonensis]|uniref:Cytochrome c2 n=1 Tax=Caldalkalibacillus uzonensis TaxID=353224 RepID=A0ABU0CRL6_9BACI|nr:cytochrome C [Caldalkalibacillus uzonensis]MDQ0339073.1 cytochrome c2 [Caldalkalibacillus uzonensis]
MKSKIIAFLISFLVAFGGTYLFFQYSGSSTGSDQGSVVGNEVEDEGGEQSIGEMVDAQSGEPLERLGCLNCHAVSSLGIQGGTAGPDLSDAYYVVEGKHGKKLEEYLQAPSSAVMSGVIESNPLTDEDIEALVSLLKEAAEKQ